MSEFLQKKCQTLKGFIALFRFELMGKHSLAALKLFFERRGTVLAAASTFYILLSAIPFILLCLRVIGFFLGDVGSLYNDVFRLAFNFFPDVAPEFLDKIKSLIEGPLFAKKSVTVVNIGLLSFSSLSLFNSIWSGLYLLTGDQSFNSKYKHVKGMAVIGISVLILGIYFSIGPIIALALGVLQNNIFSEFLVQHFAIIDDVISKISEMGLRGEQFLKTSYFAFIFLTLYFTLLFRWINSKKLAFVDAFKGAVAFVVILLLGKSLFWLYILTAKDGLQSYYGQYYTLIIGLVWSYFMMNFFFYSACLCHIFKRESLA